jgi:protein-S-isoprenylcysteine O-methyltransferase Ste14
MGSGSPMNDDVARSVLLIEVAVLAPIGVYHRYRANTGESLDRQQEGWLFQLSLRPLGALFIMGVVAYLWQPQWMEWSQFPLPGIVRWFGVGLGCVAGVLLVWTFRSLGHNLTDTVVTRRAATLVTDGPYRWVRHPLYVAFGLSVLANSLVASNWFILLTGLACFGLMVARSFTEEQKLVERFGIVYVDYAQVTGRFIPQMRALMHPHFDGTNGVRLKRRWGWSELAVFLLTMAYLVPFGAICIGKGNREFLLYLAVMMTLIPIIAFLHARIELHSITLAGLSLWGLAHLAGGLLSIPKAWPHDDEPVLYNLWLLPGIVRYDQLVHAFGFGLTTWLCWQGLRAAVRHLQGPPLSPTWGLLTLCVLSGMGLGALNEVVEFIAVLRIPNTNVGGYTNTGWDLVFNALGSVVSAIAIAIWDRPNKASY